MYTRSRAITGSWKDYTTGDNLLSVADPWGYLIIGVSTVWLSWSTKYIKRFSGNLALWVHLYHNKPYRSSDDDEATSESTSLLSSNIRQASLTDTQALAKIFKETSGVRDLFWESLFSKDLTHKSKRLLFLFTMLVAGASAAMIIECYFAAKVRTTGPARLASDHCGLWIFDGEKRSEAATRAGLLDLEKEERAAKYAEDCYRPSSGFDATRCDFFYRPKITFSAASYTNDCPFQNDICRQNQTVTFTTPMIDGNDIGINSPKAPKFRRSTTCSPLSMDYPFVQNTTDNGTTTYYYYYGPKPGDDPPVNYTFKTVGDPWDRLAPVYDLFAYSTASEPPLWQPRPELTPPEYSTVTIMFISSLRILYEKWSDDPIFPADMAWSVPGDSNRWFRNSDPRARPLACINSIETCAADGTSCWSIRAPDNISNLEWTPDYTLLYTSLYHTDIYDSVKKRLGRGLLAQRLVSGYFSDALSDYHWVDEIENMVQIAHARTQINAWSVASGEDSIHEGKDGFYSITEKYGDLCGRYKFNPQDYASFHLAAFIIIILSWPLLCFLTLDWKPVENTLKTWFSHFRSMCKNSMIRLRASRSGSRQEAVNPVPSHIGSVGAPVPDPPNQTLDESSLESPPSESLSEAVSQLQADSGGSIDSETTRKTHIDEILPEPPLAESSQTASTRPQIRSDSRSEGRSEIRTETEERTATDVPRAPKKVLQARSERRTQNKSIVRSPAAIASPPVLDEAEVEWEPLLYLGVIQWLFWLMLRLLWLLVWILPKLFVRCCTGIWRRSCGPG